MSRSRKSITPNTKIAVFVLVILILLPAFFWLVNHSGQIHRKSILLFSYFRKAKSKNHTIDKMASNEAEKNSEIQHFEQNERQEIFELEAERTSDSEVNFAIVPEDSSLFIVTVDSSRFLSKDASEAEIAQFQAVVGMIAALNEIDLVLDVRRDLRSEDSFVIAAPEEYSINSVLEILMQNKEAVDILTQPNYGD